MDTLFRFVDSVIDRMHLQGRPGSAKNLSATLSRLKACTHGNDIPLDLINHDFVEDFAAWLSAQGIRSNSVSFYIRNLRAVYRRAVTLDIVPDAHPFRHAYTKIERTVKRAIAFDHIRAIKDLPLTPGSSLDIARDIFMFLFYTRGMSFIDAAYLRVADIRGGRIVYSRHKTHRRLAVAVNSHIAAIIDKYADRSAPYILPILSDTAPDTRRQYESALRRTNNALKKIARLAHLPLDLTTYTARHSWATIAKNKGVPTATISDALGHESEHITQIYLASISDGEIDRANDTVLSGL